MKREILIRFLNNHCTESEFEEVVQWVQSEALSKESWRWGFDDWKSYLPEGELENNEQFSSLLDKIHHEINLHEQQRQVNKTVTLRQISTWLVRVAAIMLFPVLGGMFYMHSQWKVDSATYSSHAVDSVEVIAPVGSRTILQLADGTEVHLNYGSTIKYPRSFVGDTREVTLKGEGYFNVSHNPEKPFIVNTGKLNVKAVGTEFNVMAYPDDPVIATTLVEGNVMLETCRPDGLNIPLGAMVPGQYVSYNIQTGRIASQIGSIDKYIAWKDGRIVLDNEPITRVADRLGRMFNVDIELADDVKNFHYTVTFIDDPLFLILDLMTEITPITYKTLPRKKLPDGAFSKQKIVIEKRKQPAI